MLRAFRSRRGGTASSSGAARPGSARCGRTARASSPRIWAVPGVRRHQTGDGEMRAIVPIEALGAVAAIIRARRRYAPSPAQLRNLVTPSTRATSRLQDATSTGRPSKESESNMSEAVVAVIQGGTRS
jgi:hypothetical protein